MEKESRFPFRDKRRKENREKRIERVKQQNAEIAARKLLENNKTK